MFNLKYRKNIKNYNTKDIYNENIIYNDSNSTINFTL
jgi:hypothetical protein